MKKDSRFNRCRPLLERKHVPCEFILISGKPNGGVIDGNNVSKRRENFTLRILEGHRTNKDNGRMERAIRLEISDEYNKSHHHSDLKSHHDNIQSDNGTPFTCPVPPQMKQSVNNEGYFSNSIEMMEVNSNPVQLYELEVGESDFAALQKDQALLVDFANFSDSFIHLLSLCNLGKEEDSQDTNAQSITECTSNNKENIRYDVKEIPSNPLFGCQLSATGGIVGQNRKSFTSPKSSLYDTSSNVSRPMGGDSMYTCRIEQFSNDQKLNPLTNSWNQHSASAKNTYNAVRFSIVESNQFRELTHLSLNLLIGSDASIKSYLSLRLYETIGTIAMLKHKFHKEKIRASDAEQSCNEIEKRFNELMNATQQEKDALVQEADETIQKQNTKMCEEVNIWKEKSKRDIASMKKEFETMEQTLNARIESLERINLELENNSEKIKEKNIKLTNCLHEQESISDNLASERVKLNNELIEEKNERKKAESELCKNLERLNLLEDANKEKGGLLNQMEESIKKSSNEAQEAHAQSENCALRLHMTEQELGSLKEELVKTKELLSRYQTDRQEMKRRMKSKVDLIQKQEEILASNEINSTETYQRMEQSEKDLFSAKEEVEKLKQTLKEANETIQDNKKTLDDNQQVIAWLNKELNERKIKPSCSSSSTLNTSSTILRPAFSGHPSSATHSASYAGKIPKTYQYATPQFPTINTSYQANTFNNTNFTVEPTKLSSYQASQSFVPKVTPNMNQKTPSKIPTNQPFSSTSDLSAETRPRAFTPAAMKINR